MVETLNKYLASVFTVENHVEFKELGEIDNDVFKIVRIRQEEVLEVLKRIKIDKSLGRDCVYARTLWEARKEIAGPLAEVGPFSLRVLGGGMGKSYLSPQEEYPLCQLAAESICVAGPVQFLVNGIRYDIDGGRFSNDNAIESQEISAPLLEHKRGNPADLVDPSILFGSAEDEYVPDSESVRQQQQLHHQPQTYTLSQCFHLYTKEEQLAPDDAWRCPHCKQLQQGSIKLSLWTLPDVLIIHLKRFKQEGDKRTKLQNLVKFPLTGLDMTPHVVKRSQSSWSLPSHWSPWRRPYGLGRDPEDYLYDLYAVCNHHGTMQGGHYTASLPSYYIAYCKNSVDGLWYCFDDSDVQQLLEDDVSGMFLIPVALQVDRVVKKVFTLIDQSMEHRSWNVMLRLYKTL
eukprot:g48006.t1